MNTLSTRHLLLALAGPAIGIILVAMLASAAGGGIERTLIVFFISLTAVAGMGLYSGNSGILSFGHLSFMGIAAYTSGILTLPLQMKQLTLPELPDFLAAAHLSFLPSLMVAVLFAMLVALLTGIVISRLEGSAATIATLALLIIVHGVIIGARDVTRGSQSFFGVPRDTGIWTAAAVCIIALLTLRLFRDSVPGLKLRASREDAIAAKANGIGIRGERLLAWVVSAGLVALAGVALGHFLGAFSPKKFYFVDTFTLLAMLIVGGMTTMTGAVVGAVAITTISEILRRFEGGIELLGIQLPDVFGLTQVGIGLLILFVMFRRPEGLAGTKEWDEALSRPRSNQAQLGGPTELSLARAPDRTLTADGLTKKFSGLTAVDDVSISLRTGEILGLIGPNGSGKTTLLNLLSGVLPVTSGTILLDELDVTNLSPQRYAGLGIARTFQNVRLFKGLTVKQNTLVAALIGWPRIDVVEAKARAQEVLAIMGVAEAADAKAGTLSYGDQRRVEIARALALNPSFLFLDEPAAGMNREETDVLMRSLQDLRESLGIGILIVDHDLPLITRMCERVVVLNEGKLIAEGAPKDVQRNSAVITAYLGRGHRPDYAA